MTVGFKVRDRGMSHRAALLSAALIWCPITALGVDWNGTDPGSSAISANGLTDNYGQLTDESVVYNYAESARGTGTYLGNGWVLTAQHVVEGTGGYGTLAPTSQISVNIYGTYYTADSYQGFGSSDIMLVHLAGAGSGTATTIPGVERSQIYTGSSETGNLEQLAGFGYYGQLNSGTNSTNTAFHRGFNIAYSDGGSIDVSANGSARLVQDGYLLGYQQSGDSGSALWMDNGPDQDLDLHDWSIIGALDTGTTPGYFGDGGQYARVSSYAGTIINTVFPHAWLTWTANSSAATAVDGSGTWNLTSTNFTDGTNYAFNGPERTQIVTFGAGNGSAGTVTLGANINIDSITFNAAGSGSYNIAGGAYSITLTQGSTITTNVNATISAPMRGGSTTENGTVNEVTKNGSATLTLAGPVTFSTGVFFRMRAGTTLVTTGGSVAVFGAYADVGEYIGDVATLTVAGSGIFTDTGTPGDLNLGDLGGTGILNVQDSATLSASNLYVGKGSAGLTGAGGTGTVNLTGGKITAANVSLGTLHPQSAGVFNLAGGTLVTASITGGLGTSTFNFNGGQINASASSTTFMQNLTAANINSAGIINTNGYNVTLNQPLIHAAAAPAVDGGLTKIGNGTLTLGGASTYTGPTLINAGTLTLNPAAGAAAVAIQPVASYSFDNVSGSTVTNGGTGGIAMNGTLTGGATIVSGGKFGNAVSLSGSGSVVVNNPIEDTGGAANWTISAWVHTTTPGAAILDKSDGSTWTWDNSVFYLGGGNGAGAGGTPSAVRYGRGLFQAQSSSKSVVDGTWHMVTYVDAAGAYSIYTDGVQVALSAANSGFEQAVEQGSVVSFGITTDPYNDGTTNFKGLLDEIQIYSQALTPSQIQRLYTTDSPNPPAAASVLPIATPVTVQSGATFSLATASQSIGSLSGGGSVNLGTGTLTLNGSGNTSFTGVISGSGSLTHNGAGTQQLAGADTYSGTTNVSNGVLNLGIGSNTSVTSIQVRNSAGIAVTGGMLIAGVAPHPSRTVFVVGPARLNVTGGLTVTGTGTFDLGDNDVDLQNGGSSALAGITNDIRTGFANGNWNGFGLVSASAASDTTHLTTLGVILNNGEFGTTAGSLGAFDTINPGSNDVLIKYTYFGDANLDGKVDGSDYSQIDNGFLNGLTGWYNGDINYDGTVDGSDYTLIDNAFNNQSASLATQLGVQTAMLDQQIAGQSAVPEPVSCLLPSIGLIGLLSRRRLAGRNR